MAALEAQIRHRLAGKGMTGWVFAPLLLGRSMPCVWPPAARGGRQLSFDRELCFRQG